MELTAEKLRCLLAYDHETGVFCWRERRRGTRATLEAGKITSYGYIAIKIDGTCYLAHRLAWLYMHGEWPLQMIDHKNGDRGDNRVRNLRDVSNSVNQQNRLKASCKLGLLGVRFRRGKFEAQITVAGKQKYLGRFKTAGEASVAYWAATNKTARPSAQA